MRFFKYLFFLLALLFIAGSFYVATLKSDYIITKNQTVNAPVSVVYDEILTCKNWEYWNLYTGKESIVTSLKDAGKMVSSWESKGEKGKIYTILAHSPEKITQKLQFNKRPELHFLWDFKKRENGTEVTLTVKGKKSFLDKIYELAQIQIKETNEEKYQQELELLAHHLEKKMEKHQIITDGITDVGGTFYLYITRSSKLENVNDEMQKSLLEINNYIKENEIIPSGKSFALYHKRNTEQGTVLFSCCVPIRERMATYNNVLVNFLKPHRTFKTTLKGDSCFLKETWDDAYKSIAERGLKLQENGEPFEIYSIGASETTDPTKWVTEIYIPIEQE